MKDSDKVVIIEIFYPGQVKSYFFHAKTQENTGEKLFKTLKKPSEFLTFDFSFN